MTQPATPLRIPETMGPQEIGPYIRELREYFKLTPQDVSERLHIRVRYVTAIEEGRFDAMPGKVYARGYVHTYAEFLGLDADQVVAQCFPAKAPPLALVAVAPEVVAPKPKPVVSEFAPKPPPLLRDAPASGRGRGIMVMLLAAVAVLVVVTQFGALFEGSSAPRESTVAEVPESLLSSVRSTVMPQARNYSCLTGNLLLSCFFAGQAVALMDSLQTQNLVAAPY